MCCFLVSGVCLFALLASASGFLDLLPNLKGIARFVVGRSDNFKSTPELIRSHGYPVEVHDVLTMDGYILQLHRIPGRKHHPKSPGPVALIQHGLVCDSATFVLGGPTTGLGYLLADEGYDVWLGNSRGNRYSRKHLRLSPDALDGKFWQFSWHEMGKYDLPAMIDYILKVTNKPDLIYIGHSQGTTEFFVMGSERPEYNGKIKAMFALAPVAYMSHAPSPILRDPLNMAFHALISGYEVFNSNDMLSILAKSKCMANLQVTNMVCVQFISMLSGYDADQLDLACLELKKMYIHRGPEKEQVVPVRVSYETILNKVMHYEQLFRSGYFRQFDYGRHGNQMKYGSMHPPEYNLQNITCPVILYYGRNDYLSAVEDVEKLYSKLGNAIGKFAVSSPLFNHMDFLWAKDVKTLLYSDLISKMEMILHDQSL